MAVLQCIVDGFKEELTLNRHLANKVGLGGQNDGVVNKDGGSMVHTLAQEVDRVFHLAIERRCSLIVLVMHVCEALVDVRNLEGEHGGGPIICEEENNAKQILGR